MKIEEIFLFDGTGAEERRQMIKCFDIRTRSYMAGETVCDFGKGTDKLCIILSGRVSLVRIDAEGNRAVLESLSENDVFGDVIAFSGDTERGVFAVCDEKCVIAFMSYEHIAKRCPNACPHHTTAVKNMFRVAARKAQALSEHIEVLSNRSIREKLMCLFSILSADAGERTFTLPYTKSYLAEYICADRSAMMRELKNMESDGLIKADGRKITLGKGS